jgi:hypothetical protein
MPFLEYWKLPAPPDALTVICPLEPSWHVGLVKLVTEKEMAAASLIVTVFESA